MTLQTANLFLLHSSALSLTHLMLHKSEVVALGNQYSVCYFKRIELEAATWLTACSSFIPSSEVNALFHQSGEVVSPVKESESGCWA